MTIRAYDRDVIRFATWVERGRDPEVAYLDERQLVIGSAELRVEIGTRVSEVTATR